MCFAAIFRADRAISKPQGCVSGQVVHATRARVSTFLFGWKVPMYTRVFERGWVSWEVQSHRPGLITVRGCRARRASTISALTVIRAGDHRVRPTQHPSAAASSSGKKPARWLHTYQL
jgi:hypothetical protein